MRRFYEDHQMKDEALKLALEALEQYTNVVTSVNDPNNWETVVDGGKPARDAIIAIKQALAAPTVQEPWGACVFGRVFVGRLPEHARKFSEEQGVPIQWLYTTPPAAQRQWVGLTDKQKSLDNAPPHFDRSQASAWQDGVYWAEAKLKQKNTAAQPAVPDAMTSADIQEHIEYVAGWNDCRQAMLEMLK
jgi:hypothetical protein